MPRFIDLTGKKFSRLTVCWLEKMSKRGAHWVCSCECGGATVATVGNLRSGNSESCGCLTRESASQRFTKHGGSGTKLYRIWASMISRCTNKNNANYYRYGGRGITVCDQWATSFDAFVADMGPRPTPTHTVERRDNHQGYNPGNCYWATMAEQSRNKRNNRLIETPQGSMLLCDAAIVSGLPVQTLWKRLRRGWNASDLFLPNGTYTKTRQGVALAQPQGIK